MADVNATGKPSNGQRQHWITGVSLTTAAAAVFFSGVMWTTVQGHDRAIEKLDTRIARLESDHAAAIPALRKLEAEYQEMKEEIRRLRWRLGDGRGGPR